MERTIFSTPEMECSLFDGMVTVKGFGVKEFTFGYFHNWSLALWEGGDVFLPTIMSIEKNAHGMEILAPYPTKFNGKIVRTDDTRFSEIMDFKNTMLLRGPYADGVILPKANMGYAVSSADCATLILSYKNQDGEDTIVACHAGRNSILDMKLFAEGKPSRENESVVWSVMEDIPKTERKNAKAWIGFAINPGPHFEHHRNNRKNPHNGKMIDYIKATYGQECFLYDGESYDRGWLDLKALIRAQLYRGGILEENITLDNVCTYGDKRENGTHRWYSQVRTPGMRNLILVTRN